ncbi:MAG: type I glyceraldehyde-3-phosphate dehydrogenase [Gammaproteobacteria bacterium]|nr:type I glyceraldehyde-3-phosphate dehydrogenase [Gammaproteobacteria bacterium]
MAIKVGINGYGRIGRMVLRAIYELGRRDEIQVVAINTSHPIADEAFFTAHDSAHGRFPAEVSHDENHIIVNGDKIRVFADRNPATIPWSEMGVDVVFECTGKFTSKEAASQHIRGTVKKVLISAPGGEGVDATIVYGVNHELLRSDMTVVSNASCTTNCLAPMVKPLQDAIGIESGLMTTIHAYTNDQNIVDGHHKDLRRARAAAQNIIPTKTGAAKAVGLVLPELAGKLDGFAMRVPTQNVSVVDLSFVAKRDTTKDEVNALVKAAAETGPLKGVLGYNTQPLVSIDFNHDPRASIFDSTQTKVSGRLVKVLAWYDNEWGFSVQMLNTAAAMFAAK